MNDPKPHRTISRVEGRRARIQRILHGTVDWLFFSKATSWATACVGAGFAWLGELHQTRLCDLPGDGHVYAVRTFRTVLLQPWWPGCGYYCWTRRKPWGETGWHWDGHGRARWFWRAPKGARWFFARSFTFGG